MLNYLPTAKGLLQAGLPFTGADLTIRGVEVFKSVQGPQGLDAIYNSDSANTPYTYQLDVGVQREIMHNLSVSADYVMRARSRVRSIRVVLPGRQSLEWFHTGLFAERQAPPGSLRSWS